MWYIRPDYDEKLPRFGEFDIARVLVLEDVYSHIVPITAKEGKIEYGWTEEHFCHAERHVVYSLQPRGNTMLTQLSKLDNFSKFQLQQVSETWKV